MSTTTDEQLMSKIKNGDSLTKEEFHRINNGYSGINYLFRAEETRRDRDHLVILANRLNHLSRYLKDKIKLKFLFKKFRANLLNSDSCQLTYFTAFIKKFYFDAQFNLIYSIWIKEANDNYLKPSLDHIIPKRRGGSSDLSNLRMITWFENTAKGSMLPETWEKIASNIQNYVIRTEKP